MRACTEGCAERKDSPGAELEGAPRVSKRNTELLFCGIRLVCFSEKSLFIDVFGTLSVSPLHGDGYTSSNNNRSIRLYTQLIALLPVCQIAIVFHEYQHIKHLYRNF